MIIVRDQENNREQGFESNKFNCFPRKDTHFESAFESGKQMRTHVCASCNAYMCNCLAITDRYIMRVQPNLEYHANCLTCYCCKRPLNESCTTFVRSSKTYCKEDYYKEFGRRCSRCRGILQQMDQIIRSQSSVYHQNCFTCSSCQTQLNVGDYYLKLGEDLFCRPECLATAGTRQSHNFGKISAYASDFSPFLTSAESKRSVPLPAQPPMPSHADQKYGDFLSLKTENGACGIDVPTTSTATFDYHHVATSIANANGFSIEDPSRIAQRRPYEMAEEFGHDFLGTDNESSSTDLRHKTHCSMSTSSGADSPYSNPDSVTAPSSTNSGCMVSAGHTTSGTSTSTTASVNNQSKKMKKDKPAQRVRTVLNDHQLKILKQMYVSNQRPDQALKEQLVEMTGLSARVIRVWFQNKRCKDKKKQNAIKEQEQNNEKEQTLQSLRLNGIGPLIAESPITFIHDPIGGGLSAGVTLKPVDIRAFPQNPTLWDDGAAGGGGALSPFGGMPPPSAMDAAHQQQLSMMMHNMLANDNNVNSGEPFGGTPYGGGAGDFLPSAAQMQLSHEADGVFMEHSPLTSEAQ